MQACSILLVATYWSRWTALAFTPSSFGCIHRPPSVPTSTSLHLGDFFGEKTEDPPASATGSVEQTEDKGYYDEDDPIEKLFGFFFGKKENAPLG